MASIAAAAAITCTSPNPPCLPLPCNTPYHNIARSHAGKKFATYNAGDRSDKQDTSGTKQRQLPSLDGDPTSHQPMTPTLLPLRLHSSNTSQQHTHDRSHRPCLKRYEGLAAQQQATSSHHPPAHGLAPQAAQACSRFGGVTGRRG